MDKSDKKIASNPNKILSLISKFCACMSSICEKGY